MKKPKTENQKANTSYGFTLVETMVAVFILTIALTSLLNLTARSLFSARYARNEITANYLMQEIVDYIRNQRDSIAFLKTTDGGWQAFLNKFEQSTAGPCFTDDGCDFDINIEDTDILEILECDENNSWGEIKCPILNFDPNAIGGRFYTHQSIGQVSNFKRMVYLQLNPARDELWITVTIEWLNGSLVRTRSLKMSLLNWFARE